MEQEILPEITTTLEFNERVEHTCQEFHLAYATVVRLLEELIKGTIHLMKSIRYRKLT